MKTLFSMILFLALASPTHAEWTKTDTAFQVGYSIFHIIDWGQTRDIAKNPDKFQESSWYLGKHPSVGKVDTYFGLTLIGHTTVSYLLPSKYRRWWQVGWIGIESYHVGRNINAGVKISF